MLALLQVHQSVRLQRDLKMTMNGRFTVAHALLRAASPLLGTLRVTPEDDVHMSLNTARKSASAEECVRHRVRAPRQICAGPSRLRHKYQTATEA